MFGFASDFHVTINDIHLASTYYSYGGNKQQHHYVHLSLNKLTLSFNLFGLI